MVSKTCNQLNNKFDVKHLVEDLKQGGLPDPEVYQLAVREHRIVVTYNTKHFRGLAGTKEDAGIIGVSPNLPASQVDTKLTALLTKRTPQALQRKLLPLTGESRQDHSGT